MPARKATASRKTARKIGGKGGRAVATSKASKTSALTVPGELTQEWRDRLKGHAAKHAATAAGATGWPYIGTKGGIFRHNEDKLEELPPMLILDVLYENAFFDGEYDSDNPSGPDCFALSTEEKTLAPPETLGDARQCLNSEPAGSDCSGCWANVFNTADRGKGKACKNTRRLAMLPADDDLLNAKSLSQIEGAMLRLPVTSVKAFSAYANKITKGLGIPLYMLRTHISIFQDDKTQHRIEFEPYDDLVETPKGMVPQIIADAPLLEVITQRYEEAQTYLNQVPSSGGDDENAPKRKQLGAGRRATTTKGAKADAPKRKVARKGSRATTGRKAGTRAEKKF